jgi:Uma2 family endonuclease
LYEPEPDAAIIRGAPVDYRTRLALPADVMCVIEAAHSSLVRDQETRLAAYAAAGIPQYVILNLQSGVVEIYTQPDAATGTYRAKAAAARSQSVALFLPNNERLTVAASECCLESRGGP